MYQYKKVPVDMTPGAMIAIMNKKEPGIFLENQDCMQGDLPVVFANEAEAKQFIKDSGIPEKQTVLVGTDNAEWFMPGDNVYQVTKTEKEE